MTAIIKITECEDDMDLKIDLNGATEDEKTMAIQIIILYSDRMNVKPENVKVNGRQVGN